MRNGFTIIELLVASLLLGMLTTILTMIFNQSSIAWRTGIAGTVDMDTVRQNIAEVREEADNAFVAVEGSEAKLYALTGLWDDNGNPRTRACNAQGSTDAAKFAPQYLARFVTVTRNEPRMSEMNQSVGVGNGTASGGKTYFVNVMSAGPDRKFDTWDDIWSAPDAFD